MAAIDEVRVYLVPLARRPGYPPYRLTVVEVRDADGATGIGEVGLVYGDGASAAAKMVLEIANNHLIGHDGRAITAFAHRAYRNAFWSQSGGVIWFGALSALDEALWDLRGRRAGEPVHRLLGGPAQTEIRFYCNGWSRSATDPADWGRRAAEAVAAGYDALKFDPYKYRPDGSTRSLTEKVTTAFHRLAVERTAAVREAVGPDVDLILELHGNLSRLEALRACTDITFKFPFGEQELWGIAARGNFDLTQHQEHSGKSMEYFDEARKERYIPHVVEPSVGVDRILLAEEAHVVVYAQLPGQVLGRHAVGPVADEQELDRVALLPQPVEHVDDVASPFDRAEVGDVHQHLLAVGAERTLEVLLVGPLEARRVDEVGHDLDVAVDVEVLVRLARQIFGHGRDAVGLVDRVVDHGREGGVAAHELDAASVPTFFLRNSTKITGGPLRRRPAPSGGSGGCCRRSVSPR